MPNTYSSEWKLPSYIPLSLTMFAWHFVVVEESFLYIFYLYIHCFMCHYTLTWEILTYSQQSFRFY